VKVGNERLARKREVFSVGLGVVLGLFVYINLYFAVMMGVVAALAGVVMLMSGGGLRFIKRRGLSCLVAMIISMIVMAPYMVKVKDIIFWGERESDGFGGLSHYSANVASILVPNPSNFIYLNNLEEKLKWLQVRDGSLYPGLFGLVGVLLFVGSKKKKDISKQLILIIGMLFVLSLGPKMIWVYKTGRTFSTRITDVSLPFAWFGQIPILKNFRAPIRWAVPLGWLMIVLASIEWQRILGNSRKRAILMGGVIMSVVLIDQHYRLPETKQKNLPMEAYKYIRESQSDGAVMELPFTLRDGMKSLGDSGQLGFEWGQLEHGNRVVGGYASRIPSKVREYYMSCPVLRYGIDVSSSRDSLSSDDELPIDLLKNGVEVLDIEHLLVSDDLSSVGGVIGDFEKLGFDWVLKDGKYTLLEFNGGGGEYGRLNFGEGVSGCQGCWGTRIWIDKYW